MFIIDQSESYKWPVKFTGIDESGQHKTQAFTAIFKRVPQSKLEEMSQAGLTDRELCRAVLTGWQDIKTSSGEEVPFTTATLELLLDNAGVAAAIFTEFMASIAGAKRKN